MSTSRLDLQFLFICFVSLAMGIRYGNASQLKK